MEIEEDGVATFSCELNYVVANVEWLLNNVRLYSNAISRIQHMGTMHSLIIKKLRPQESRVTFKAGLLSETTTLKVKGQEYLKGTVKCFLFLFPRNMCSLDEMLLLFVSRAPSGVSEVSGGCCG